MAFDGFRRSVGILWYCLYCISWLLQRSETKLGVLSFAPRRLGLGLTLQRYMTNDLTTQSTNTVLPKSWRQ